MQARSVEHETITIERDFKAAPPTRLRSMGQPRSTGAVDGAQ
jgi:hypothetical protein